MANATFLLNEIPSLLPVTPISSIQILYGKSQLIPLENLILIQYDISECSSEEETRNLSWVDQCIIKLRKELMALFNGFEKESEACYQTRPKKITTKRAN